MASDGGDGYRSPRSPRGRSPRATPFDGWFDGDRRARDRSPREASMPPASRAAAGNVQRDQEVESLKQAVRDLTMQQNTMQRLMVEQRDLMNALVTSMNQPKASPPTSSVTPPAPAASVPVSQVNVPLSVPLGASGSRQASGGPGSQKLSDKLTSPMPKADSENWSTRPLEVLGFRRCCESIISWREDS